MTRDPISMTKIVALTAWGFGPSPRTLTGPSRRRRATRARFGAVLVARRTRHDLTFGVIGQHLGGRDYSTMCHAYAQGESLFDRDADFRREVEAVADLLGLTSLPPRRAAGVRACALDRAIVGCERRLAYLRAQRADLSRGAA